MAKRIQSWEVSGSFWERVEPFIPRQEREQEKTYRRKAGGGRKPIPYRRVLKGSYMFYVPVVNGRPCQKSDLAVPVLFTDILSDG